MKVHRKQIEKELEKLSGQRGIGNTEQQTVLLVMALQVQLEILDVLDDVLHAVTGTPVEREGE